jgi:methanogenic corrinoid protein MtbC1
LRTESGQRVYRRDDVEAVQLISRRIAAGERVGHVMRDLFGGQTDAAAASNASKTKNALSLRVEAALAVVRRGELFTLKLLLEGVRNDLSAQDFIEDFIAPLTTAVGNAWADGTLPIHAEHLFSALIERQLMRDAERFECHGEPCVLLCSPAGEKHTLGLSMIHLVLAEAGVNCLRLTSDVPVDEIAASCKRYGFRVVALSASIHYPPKILRSQIAALRTALAANVELWVGGGGIDRVSRLPAGTRCFGSLSEAVAVAETIAPCVKFDSLR